MSSTLYVDNAATSFPKAPGVLDAMLGYARDFGASPGRGTYASSLHGARLITQCRERINRLIGGEDPRHVVFTLNTTDALNLAIQGFVARRRRAGLSTRIVTSDMDHNSILRPLRALEADGVIWTSIAPDPRTGRVDAAAVSAALTPETSLVALQSASNVTGALQPIEEVGALCAARGIAFLVDAAQSLGHVPLDVREACIDFLAFPGHKGLLGPQGTGGLYIRPGAERLLDPYRQGGTGSESERDVQPDTLPSRFECGSHNTPGIVGLGAAVQWLLDRGVDRLRAHEVGLSRRMLAGLARLDGYELIGAAGPEDRVATFSLRMPGGLDPHELAAELERRAGVLARAGIHCAPRAHGALGTLDRTSPGACRVSFGAFNTEADVDRVLEALASIARDCASVPQASAPCHPGRVP